MEKNDHCFHLHVFGPSRSRLASKCSAPKVMRCRYCAQVVIVLRWTCTSAYVDAIRTTFGEYLHFYNDISRSNLAKAGTPLERLMSEIIACVGEHHLTTQCWALVLQNVSATRGWRPSTLSIRFAPKVQNHNEIGCKQWKWAKICECHGNDRRFPRKMAQQKLEKWEYCFRPGFGETVDRWQEINLASVDPFQPNRTVSVRSRVDKIVPCIGAPND